ncbi:serine hydrolase domain-containing protein [Sporosarcina sp. YIM B06819]|uniref:serine hydrolase domain-containing protein n=1 Tax=Sporosarcina sp. YIM B06819 TaxID=3081769 RepID=UPI00298D38B6|nr:serine hydrolase domain-containing protein [Sporosarcina sp. YIM B06819]
MSTKYFKFVGELIQEAKEQYLAPGIVVNLITNGEIAYSKGFGFSQVDNVDKPITAKTTFSIMSITKSFTATSIMQLVEQGLLSLDDPVSRYLPYFQVHDETLTHQITIRQLLSHTAGFPGDFWIASLKDPNLIPLMKEVPEYQSILQQFPEIVLNKIRNREDVTRYFSNVNLLFEPGQGWHYCTDAYVIVSDILEKVTGVSWEDYIQDNIFNRLGLKRTFTDPNRINNEKDVTHYYTSNNSSVINRPTPINQLCAPAGFIYSNVSDLSKYIISHMNFDQSPLLNTDSLTAMQDMIANRGENLSYGLGWKVRKFNGYKVIEHGGGYPGVAAYVTMIPSEGFGMVIFSNSDKMPVQKISERVVEHFVKNLI